MDNIVNGAYLHDILKLREALQEQEPVQCITLQQFLTSEAYKKIERELHALNFRRETIPDRFSYSSCKATSLGPFKNTGLIKFLEIVVNKKLNPISTEAFRLSWKDYSLMHPKTEEKPGIDVIFDCTPEWDESWGGDLVYRDDKGNFVKTPIHPNALTIVVRKRETQKFFQYINNLAKGKKRYVLVGTTH